MWLGSAGTAQRLGHRGSGIWLSSGTADMAWLGHSSSSPTAPPRQALHCPALREGAPQQAKEVVKGWVVAVVGCWVDVLPSGFLVLRGTMWTMGIKMVSPLYEKKTQKLTSACAFLGASPMPKTQPRSFG